jgi:hypothetical protein
MIKKISLALVLGLLFTWSLPDVPALRYWLLFLSLLAVASQATWPEVKSVAKAHRRVLVLLFVFSAWLLGQAAFISHDPWLAMKEIQSQWFNALLSLGLGIILGCVARRQQTMSGALVTTALIAVWVAQAVIAVGQSVTHWWLHGELLRGLVPLTGGKLEMSFILNFLLSALTVAVLFRALYRRPFLRMPFAVLVLSLLIALFSLYLAGARNGVIGLLFLSTSAVLLYSIHQWRVSDWRRGMTSALLLLTLIIGIAAAGYRTDARWPAFVDSAHLGWAIDEHEAWKDINHAVLPLMENGQPAEASAYTRVAFIHAGLRLIREFPLGVGYGRNAFSHALQQSGVVAQVGHAHSGWVDLGIGGGIPAVVLWLLFLGALIVTGAVRYFRDQDPHGLWLLFLATGFAGRMMVDSVNRDHMLQMFLFLAGYLLVMSMRDDQLRSTAGNMK